LGNGMKENRRFIWLWQL